MTRVAKFMMAAAAATMSVAPAIAAPAAPASVRASAETENASELRGGGGIFIALLAGVAIIVAIIILGSDEADVPTSP